MTEYLVTRGHVDLARFISVVYTYQLRVQSEALGLQFDGRPPSDSKAVWHSAVEVISDKEVAVILRKRKNTEEVSRITRRWICLDWPDKAVCGVCSLRRLVRRATSLDGLRVFPSICSADIYVLKIFGATRNLGPITWHGFRRGRTVDLLQRGGSNGVSISLAELFQSGGWKLGSGALLSYIPEQDVHKERVFKISANASDTEPEQT